MTLNFYLDKNENKPAQIPARCAELIKTFKLALSAQKNGAFFLHQGRLAYQDGENILQFSVAQDFQHFLKQKSKVSPGPLYKALGLKNRREVKVVDATGGSGKDSALILSFGAQLTVFERHPILQVLLTDEFSYLRELFPNLSELVQFIPEDVSQHQFAEFPDIIYFDPMYPKNDKNSKALSRKSMMLFEKLVGEDEDQEKILNYLCSVARERVVVKRPVEGFPLLKPHMSYTGKTARYDVYKSSF